MSHKSKRRKLHFGIDGPRATEGRPFSPAAMPVGGPWDFDEFERRHEELRYRLTPDCKVHLRFNGIATQEALKKLITYLEMGIGDFPKNANNSQAQD